MADVKWSVYKHTCPNNKVYIGITCRKPENRWNNGKGYKLNKHFYNAINKYGWENIKHEVIANGLEKDEAKNFEIALIALYKSNQPEYGYNHSTGGEGKSGFVPTVETRDKIRNRLKGNHRPDDVKAKLSKAHKGKVLSAEHKRKIKSSCKYINGKPVLCVTTNKTYNSATEAARQTGISRSGITACCRGETKSVKKTQWIYVERVVVYE